MGSVEVAGAAWELADTLRGKTGDDGQPFWEEVVRLVLSLVTVSLEGENEERERGGRGLSERVVEERIASIFLFCSPDRKSVV